MIFLLELGPDSFISEKPWALALCRRLGLEPELLGTNDAYRSTFVVHEGKLEPLPQGFMLLAPTQFGPLVHSRIFSWPGKLRMALDLVLPRAKEHDDESLGSFVRRRLGREALERIAQPLIGGIYTADPRPTQSCRDHAAFSPHGARISECDLCALASLSPQSSDDQGGEWGRAGVCL